MTETTAPTTASDPRLLSAEDYERVLQRVWGATSSHAESMAFGELTDHIAAQQDALAAAQQQIAALEAEIHDRHNVEMAYADQPVRLHAAEQEVARLRAALETIRTMPNKPGRYNTWLGRWIAAREVAEDALNPKKETDG